MFRVSIISFALTFLIGCAAALVPHTNDPKEKLESANWLFGNQERPLPAERIILEAMDIYEKNNDHAGMAEANRIYGTFLRSSSIEKYKDYYKENGFRNDMITYDDRFNKSIEYFDLSKEYYQSKKQYDNLTNIFLNMSFTYIASNNLNDACLMLNKSMLMNEKFKKLNPDVKINLGGSASFREYVSKVVSNANMTDCQLK